MAQTMLVWSKATMQTSLTDMEHPLPKFGKKIHNAILGFCGDKTNPNPNSLAHQLLGYGMDQDPEKRPLRDEVYCQIMKQLSQNPTPQSISQGWRLLTLCSQYFPPSTELNNFVHIFVRSYAPSHIKQQLVDNLYAREYDGPVHYMPSVDQIPALLGGY